MRSAIAAGWAAVIGSWTLVAVGQGTEAKPPAATTPPSPPATATPAAAPAPTDVPNPSSPPAQAPPSPGPAPQAPAPSPQPQPAPASETPPGTAIPSTPAPEPALADQTPTPERQPVASERAPLRPKRDAWQDGHAVAVEASGRISGRLNAANVSANSEERAGLGLDLSGWFTLSSEYVVGFGLKRADLGMVSLSSGPNIVDAGYATTALVLGGRAFPFRGRDAEVFVGLRVGLAWQDVDATGLRQTPDLLAPATTYRCSGVDGPGFALGAEVGAALRLGQSLWLTGSVDANGYRLSSDVVDECVVGIGSIATVSIGSGLLYAFDIGVQNKLGARDGVPAARRRAARQVW